MAIVFKGSYRGVNCAPSLHCSSCYLIIFTALMAMHNVTGIISIIVAVAIVISTMTTKQHTVIDVLSAIPMFVVCAFIGKLVPFGFILNFIRNFFYILYEFSSIRTIPWIFRYLFAVIFTYTHKNL